MAKELKTRSAIEDHLNGPLGILLVYLPGCPYCEKIMPLYDAVARSDAPIRVAKAQPEVASEFITVPGYPTFVMSERGKLLSRWSGASPESVEKLVALTML